MQRRLTAILAADVVDYTRLMGEDEAGTLAALQSLRRDIFDPGVSAHGGQIVKRLGDGWIVEFSNVSEAVRCAIAIQERCRDAGPLRLRIGVHIGDVTFADDDIYGDGINIACRLQVMAAPGQVLISDVVYYVVDIKANALFGGGATHELKNVGRPVAVWFWPASVAPPIPMTGGEPTSSASDTDKPSIAVLPFDNMSGDPAQEFFADGITEDIITELSRFSDLRVIARNSAFTYKGRRAKVQDIGRDLGVRYVVEGSVRRGGNRVRVTVQLIDAASGAHIWAERYDRDLVDILDLQDELTQAIVAVLPGRLRQPEEERVKRKPPHDMAAFDCLLAGKIHHHRVTRGDNARAQELLGRAVALSPDFAQAHVWRACTLGQAIDYGFAEDIFAVKKEFEVALTTAISLDHQDAECYRLLCEVCINEFQQFEAARRHADQALRLNPNDPRIVAQQGEILTWIGRAAEGVAWIERALRLDPFNANERAHLLGRALYACGRYAEAAEAFSRRQKPMRGHRAEFAACCAQAGQSVEATKLAMAEIETWPEFSVKRYVARLPFSEQRDRDHLADGLRKAGLPE